MARAPTPAVFLAARLLGYYLEYGQRDVEGTYLEAPAERLPFQDETFALVVSYLTLIDIPDVQAAIQEMHECSSQAALC